MALSWGVSYIKICLWPPAIRNCAWNFLKLNTLWDSAIFRSEQIFPKSFKSIWDKQILYWYRNPSGGILDGGIISRIRPSTFLTPIMPYAGHENPVLIPVLILYCSFQGLQKTTKETNYGLEWRAIELPVVKSFALIQVNKLRGSSVSTESTCCSAVCKNIDVKAWTTENTCYFCWFTISVLDKSKHDIWFYGKYLRQNS